MPVSDSIGSILYWFCAHYTKTPVFYPYFFRGEVFVATTRLIVHHISRGETILQSIKSRINYGTDKNKTDGGELISSYECDYESADAEFLLSKAKYKAITGREQKKDQDVLCYQVRQSFAPGEVTPQQANAIGYDFAMRWTKGKFAFIVATHIDRHCVHSHIYYNSTALDCTHKFRDFFRSGRAIRRLSDRICLENNLSVVRDPKLHSQGQFKHYGEWLGGDKPLTYQERLKVAIDAALAGQPPDFAAFLMAMTEAGYEYKWGRGGVLSFRAEGQERFTRLRSSTLGDGYDLADIRATIEGRAPMGEGRVKAPAHTRKVNLIIDIQKKLREGKGPGYEAWCKIYNLKQMAAALQYLQENDLLEYSQLERRTEQTVDRFHELAGKIQKIEAAMRVNAELRAAMVDYARTRPVFEEYKAKKYSNKYLAEHEADIRLHRKARATFTRVLAGGKLPKMDALKAEWERLSAEKREGYRAYRAAQKDMRDVVAVKHNIDALLGHSGRSQNKEQAR